MLVVNNSITSSDSLFTIIRFKFSDRLDCCWDDCLFSRYAMPLHDKDQPDAVVFPLNVFQ